MHCWVYLEFQFFGMGCLRQKPVLLKSYQKLFPSVSSEPLKVPWCFICQTKSPHVEIKWLKGYCIPSTFTENIPDQSCISNRWTPCRSTAGVIRTWLSWTWIQIRPLTSRTVSACGWEDWGWGRARPSSSAGQSSASSVSSLSPSVSVWNRRRNSR